jgi:filamentous hemagglutinin family protein
MFVRVTGALTGLTPSNINGTLQADPTTADFNLFFINPEGVIFGPNSRLDLGGSLVASTAESVDFGGGNFFSSDLTASSSLSLLSNVPLGLQLGANPADLTVQSNNFDLPIDNTLALLGGNLNIESANISLAGANSRIELASAGANTNARFGPGFQFQDTSFSNRQDINISDVSEVTALGGSIQTISRNLTVTAGSGVSVNPSAALGLDGGNLTVNAQDTVRLSGGEGVGPFFFPSGFFGQTTGNGDAGDITVVTQNLIIEDGAAITNSVEHGGLGTGAGGEIDITAPGQVSLSGTSGGIFPSPSSILSLTLGGQPGGDVRVQTGQLLIEDGAQISVDDITNGGAGNVFVTAEEVLLRQQGRISGFTNSGIGGNLNFNVRDNIVLQFNSSITAESLGPGDGGNIDLDVGGFVLGRLPENSDVVASATSGTGGRITGNTAGVYGFREFDGVRTPLSDFTADSATGLDGIVDIQTQTPPAQEPLVDDFVSDNIAQGCRALADAGPDAPPQSQFVIVNLGGLPAQPAGAGSSDLLLISPVSPIPDTQNNAAVPDAPQTFGALAVLRLPCANFEPS